MQSKLLSQDKQRTFAIILDNHDEVIESIRFFATAKKLAAAQFTAIGAFSEATLGFFDFSIKDYKKIEVKEQVEVLTLNGDISLFNDNQQVHAHVVLGKNDGSTYGGHLLSAIVHPTLEIILTESPAHLHREMDKEAGIPLIKI